MQLLKEQLAATGGESLSTVWWVGAGLLVVGVAIAVIAMLRKRNGSNADTAAFEHDSTDSPGSSLEGQVVPPASGHHEDEPE